jgi:hypothetical protein
MAEPESSSLNTSNGSEKSARVIAFDEDDNILGSKKTKRTQIEMVDLKPKPN